MSNTLASFGIARRGLCTLLATGALVASLAANGALLPRDIDGDGVVDAYYDTAQNITWLADWSISGQLTWDQAAAWAASLNVHGVTGWRLPGLDTAHSELERLWYVTLGNLAGGLTNKGPFSNMQAGAYWTGTEYAPDTSEAWNFGADDGVQDADPKSTGLYAVAVHAGDVAPTPLAYKVIDLNPPGASWSAAYATRGGQQVGSADSHAMLWTGTAGSAVDLHPPGYKDSIALGIAGTQQAGEVTDAYGYAHAVLWGKTPWGGSQLDADLTPFECTEAFATGMDQAQQVGFCEAGSAHAMLWTGTVESAVDLHPPAFLMSFASGVGDGQQAGFGVSIAAGHTHALLWTGSAASVVDLHPAGFVGSQANAAGGGQQVGFGGTGTNMHALLWAGSAASVVDLHPAGFTDSDANAIAGGQQVGSASDGNVDHAMVWSGSAATAVDLQGFLPAAIGDSFGDLYSRAYGIDDAGNIVGTAGGYAIMWVPALPYRLDITATGAPDPILVGTLLTYTITVTNNRPSTATGVTVIDAVPWGSSVWNYDTSCTEDAIMATALTCDLGDLAAGDSRTITIDLKPTLAGLNRNRVTVSANEFVTNAVTVLTTVNPSIDLAITATDAPDPVKIGSNLTYTMTVKNRGQDPATGVVVQDTLPAGATFVSATPTQGSCSGSAVVICNLGTLAKAASAKVTIVVAPTSAGTLGNTATVSANEFDPDTSNNTAIQSTTVVSVPLPDLTGSWVSAAQACKVRGASTKCTVNGSLKVVNQGTAASGACIARIYLSSDASLSAEDVLLGQVKVPGLAAGTSKQVKVKPALPAGANASGKFVIAVIDPTNAVAEADKSNNNVATVRFP